MARPRTGQVIERRGKRGVSYALRFRAGGRRWYQTTDAKTRDDAELELAATLHAVRRGTWRPPEAMPEIKLPATDPGFHAYASQWLEERKPELRPRSVEWLEWALSGHLLGFFKDHRLADITIGEVRRYRTAKVRDRVDELVDRPLSNGSINRTLAVLASVLDAAVDDGLIAANPARGRRRRLKAETPRRTWLELDELRSLLGAAGDHRPLLATMALSGLRVGEATSLRWGDVNLGAGRLTVREAKTDAGERDVDLTPDLLSELKLHKQRSRKTGDADLVFTTRVGTPRDRNNVRARVLAPTIAKANRERKETGFASIQDGVTNHSLRRTFASLLYEAGASPAYVMGQMGHTSSALALDVYARVIQRKRDTGERVDALLRGADWAQAGTNPLEETNEAARLSVAREGNQSVQAG